MNDKKKSILDSVKNNRKLHYFLIFITICFIAVFFVFSLDKTESLNQTNNTVIGEYVSSLEKRLSSSLSKVKGAGKIEVVITVESGMETVLAMKTTTTVNENGKKETVETPILVNGKTVTLKENYPRITGVLIVAEGADNIMVLSKIQQATVSLLDINLNQIEILTMK